MRSVVVFALAGALAILVQTTLLHHMQFLPATPDLILVLCVYLGLHYHSAGGALGAFLLGYLLDAFSGTIPGLYCLTMTLVFVVVYLMSKRLWMENPVSNIAAVALGSVVKIATLSTVMLLTSGMAVDWFRVFRVLGLEAFLAAVCTPFLFSLLMSSLASGRSARAYGAE
jgi:rod shape-determining protein MreD